MCVCVCDMLITIFNNTFFCPKYSTITHTTKVTLEFYFIFWILCGVFPSRFYFQYFSGNKDSED